MEQNDCKQPRAGWRQRETERLFELAGQAQQAGRPLKSVFDAVAAETGRRPNSVRNYYYARVRETDGPGQGHRRAFEAFTETEADALVEAVLAAQASGESVRSCTLRLAAGSDKAMLRYQNKYRSMLKNNRDAVCRIRERMLSEGKPAADPYAPAGTRRAGRPRKLPAAGTTGQENPGTAVPTMEPSGAEGARAYGERICTDRKYLRILRNLDRVEGLNVNALMEALGALALSALRGTEESPVDGARLAAENEALRKQLTGQHERYRVLLGYLTRLIRVNSEFLSKGSQASGTSLSAYVQALESSVQTCRQAVLEEAR